MAEELTQWNAEPEPDIRGQLQVVHRMDTLAELNVPPQEHGYRSARP